MTPRNFSGREFCAGEPGPAVNGPAVLGICHTCGHYSMHKPTIKPDVFTYTTGPARGTKDCKNWVPVDHVATVRPNVGQGKPLAQQGVDAPSSADQGLGQ